MQSLAMVQPNTDYKSPDLCLEYYALIRMTIRKSVYSKSLLTELKGK